MTIQLIDDGGGNSHLRWDSQSVETSHLLNLLQDAAKNLHLKGVGGFVDEDGQPLDPEIMTNSQLGSVLNDYYKLTTLAEARAYFIIKAKEEAAALAETEAADRYNGA